MNKRYLSRNSTKTCIFIPVEQFFPRRHNTFIQMLAARFHVILSSKANIFPKIDNVSIEYLEDIIKLEKNPLEGNEYALAIKQYEIFLQNAVELIKGTPIRARSLNAIQQTIKNKTAHAFRISRMFRKLLEYRRIDFVVVSAEYSYLSRPVVLEAKKQNVPVVNIEHGFFGGYDYPEAYKAESAIKNIFISDYVVVDNNLEACILARHYETGQLKRSVEFLPLGTPLDNVQSALPEKAAAIRTLKIESDRPVLSLIMSWCEPKSIWQVFQQQFDEFQFLESTFKCLQKTGLAKSLNVIVKLHPAIHQFKEYSIITLITELAKKFGIEKLLVTIDKLEDVIAASDFMISSNYSSVLWEGFLAGRPIALKPSAVWLSKMNVNCLREYNEMANSDLLSYILNAEELESFIRRYLNDYEMKAYWLRAQRFRTKWKINSETSAEKSERIVQWISSHSTISCKNDDSTIKNGRYRELNKVEKNLKQETFKLEYFTDSHGNFFPLDKNLRNQLKPGWESMLQPNNTHQIVIPQQTLINTIKAWQNRVLEMKQFLQTYSISLHDKHVMEIGTCGGVAAYALAQSGASYVTGTDIASYYLMQTPGGKITHDTIRAEKQKLFVQRNEYSKLVENKISSRVDFREDDICSSKLESNSFDVIVSWEVLEHLFSPIDAFRQIWRILKPGGIAFHEYNPFFSIIGGHSLCTLDFLWGHARISETDFESYLKQIRPNEKEVALNFYRKNLNRMSLADLQNYLNLIGFHVLAMIPWPEKSHLKLLDSKILSQCKKIKPNVQTSDLISPTVWLLIQKQRDSQIMYSNDTKPIELYKKPCTYTETVAPKRRARH